MFPPPVLTRRGPAKVRAPPGGLDDVGFGFRGDD